MPTFDGDALLITLDSATSEVDAKVDLYSDWKEWFKTGTNSKYPLAFDTTGGDPTTATGAVSAFYFLRNDLGWRIKPPEENIEIVITGNLYPRDATLPMRIPTTGSFMTTIDIERDASSVVETVTSGFWTDSLTEDYPVDGQSAATPAQMLYSINQMLSEFARTGTAVSIKKRDGTEAFQLTLDSATAPTTSTQSS